MQFKRIKILIYLFNISKSCVNMHLKFNNVFILVRSIFTTLPPFSLPSSSYMTEIPLTMRGGTSCILSILV